MRVRVLDPELTPLRAHDTDAGLDLRASKRFVLEPGQRMLIGTGVEIVGKPGTVVILKPRSSLAVMGIDVMAGVIDAGYEGEVKALLINHSDELVVGGRGDRICQAIQLDLTDEPDVFEYPSRDDERAFVEKWANRKSKTVRGKGGFGSTGAR